MHYGSVKFFVNMPLKGIINIDKEYNTAYLS